MRGLPPDQNGPDSPGSRSEKFSQLIRSFRKNWLWTLKSQCRQANSLGFDHRLIPANSFFLKIVNFWDR
jgi:hypothetical protein